MTTQVLTTKETNQISGGNLQLTYILSSFPTPRFSAIEGSVGGTRSTLDTSRQGIFEQQSNLRIGPVFA